MSLHRHFNRIDDARELYLKLLEVAVKFTQAGQLRRLRERPESAAPPPPASQGRPAPPPVRIPLQFWVDLLGMILVRCWPEPAAAHDTLATLLAEHLAVRPRKLRPARRGALPLLEAAKRLFQSLENRNPYIAQHAGRVTEVALGFARHLRITPGELESLEVAGYFHDIGQVAISEAILLKPQPLSPKEWTIIQTHPQMGLEITATLGLKPEERAAILHHHERWDGRGYPHQLSGEAIPLFSRVLSLADGYAALTAGRPYRQQVPVSQALEEIGRHAGSQFDPRLAREFISLISCQSH